MVYSFIVQEKWFDFVESLPVSIKYKVHQVKCFIILRFFSNNSKILNFMRKLKIVFYRMFSFLFPTKGPRKPRIHSWATTISTNIYIKIINNGKTTQKLFRIINATRSSGYQKYLSQFWISVLIRRRQFQKMKTKKTNSYECMGLGTTWVL